MWKTLIWFCLCALAKGLIVDDEMVPMDEKSKKEFGSDSSQDPIDIIEKTNSPGDSAHSLSVQYGRPVEIPNKALDATANEAPTKLLVPKAEDVVNPAFDFNAKAVMQEKVVGGGPITPGEAPFFVQIITKNGLGRWVNGFCGGSLISPKHVLTAAHCVDDIDATIVAGYEGVYVNAYKPFDSTGNNGGEPIHFSLMESVSIHPEFNAFSYEHDAAVVTLKDPVPDASLYIPLYLSENNRSDKDTVVVYGMGRLTPSDPTTPDYLQKANLEFITNNSCKPYHNANLKESMVCAGFQIGGVDACNGDSGAPLIYETSDGSIEQVGIVSWGDGCAQRNKPGVYSDTVSQRGWIKSQVCPSLTTAEAIATPICIEDMDLTPSAAPSTSPSSKPSASPSSKPSSEPSASPSSKPSSEPSAVPSTSPSSSSTQSPQPSTSSIPSTAPSSSNAPSTLPTTSTLPSSSPTSSLEIADLACFSLGEACIQDSDCCPTETVNSVCNINVYWVMNPNDPNIPLRICEVQRQEVTPRSGTKLSTLGGRTRGSTRNLRGAK